MSDDDLGANHAWWQERALLHAESPMYRPWITKLREGEPALFPLERELVGDPAGLRLLHVPCHIGHDTLSWALLGAEVTGVDFSENALSEAAELTAALGLEAEWIHADAMAMPDSLNGRFDVVVATYGAYGWMKDLDAWVRGIARALAPGGRFILVDGHPLYVALDPAAAESGSYTVVEPVMGGGPAVNESPGSYADSTAETVHNRNVGWCHGIGEIVTALLAAGLRLDHLREHDWCVWNALPNMVERDGVFELPEPWHTKIPLMFSIVVSKPELDAPS